MTFLVNYFVYRLCDYDKSWRVMLGVFVIMAILMLFPLAPLAGFYNGLVFPGGPEAATPMWRIFGAFFGPGLGEELIKALPVFALVIVGARYTQPFAKRVGVFEPLDGILIGVASASAFALMETMLGYIWQQINQETVPWIVEACKAAGLRPGQYTPDCVAAGITAGSNWGNVGVGGSDLYAVGLGVTEAVRPRIGTSGAMWPDDAHGCASATKSLPGVREELKESVQPLLQFHDCDAVGHEKCRMFSRRFIVYNAPRRKSQPILRPKPKQSMSSRSIKRS
jgi:hypothetical protein